MDEYNRNRDLSKKKVIFFLMLSVISLAAEVFIVSGKLNINSLPAAVADIPDGNQSEDSAS